MINNKKLMLVLAVSASMMLAACGGNNETSSQATKSSGEAETSSVAGNSSAAGDSSVAGSSTGGETANVPTEEGKTTFYIEVASDSIALPSWCSYFLTGCMNGWATTPSGGAIEFHNLENTNIYYALVAGYDDAANEADRGYQVTMGYNASSQLSDSQQGINWSYKAQSNASFSGLDHPTFDAPVDSIVHITAKWSDGTVDAGGFKWTASLPEPVQVSNYEVIFTIGEDVINAVTAWNTEKGDSGVTGYAMKGSTNNWTWTALTKIDATHYSFTVDKIICGVAYEMCVAPMTAAGVDGDAYSLTGNGVKANDTTDEDGTYHIGNLSFTPLSLDGNDYDAAWGTLSLPTYANGSKSAAYVLPSASKLAEKVVITVSDIEDGTGLGEGLDLFVAGDWNGWNNDAANKMTKGEDGKYTYTMPIDLYVGVAHEFGIIATSDWAGKLVADDGKGGLTNWKIVPEANKYNFDITGDLSKVGVAGKDQAGTLNYHGTYVNGIVITVSDKENGTGLGEGLNLFVAGSFNGWNNAEANKMTKGEDGKYTYTIPENAAVAGFELQFGIISNSSWAGKLVGADDQNFAFTPEVGKLHVNIVGDLSLNGTTNSAGTLEYVA